MRARSRATGSMRPGDGEVVADGDRVPPLLGRPAPVPLAPRRRPRPKTPLDGAEVVRQVVLGQQVDEQGAAHLVAQEDVAVVAGPLAATGRSRGPGSRARPRAGTTPWLSARCRSSRRAAVGSSSVRKASGASIVTAYRPVGRERQSPRSVSNSYAQSHARLHGPPPSARLSSRPVARTRRPPRAVAHARQVRAWRRSGVGQALGGADVEWAGSVSHAEDRASGCPGSGPAAPAPAGPSRRPRGGRRAAHR